MACAASTDRPAPLTDPTPGFDPGRPYSLHPQVALRPEPFGALAYHYGNRRLVFLRSPELVQVVETLSGHPSARAAVDAVVADHRRRPAVDRALAALAGSEVIRAR